MKKNDTDIKLKYPIELSTSVRDWDGSLLANKDPSQSLTEVDSSIGYFNLISVSFFFIKIILPPTKEIVKCSDISEYESQQTANFF